ncbi:BRO family protein [Rhodocyclus tenuis]|uniref:BRO family protein n=1 Tax=Rhodocyclus tenuis TaxID=1066 RepID=UPI001906EADB
MTNPAPNQPLVIDAPTQQFQFNNVATGETFSVSALEKDGQAWFIASEVCRALDLDPTAVRRLDDDERNTLRITQQIRRGNPLVSVINESGLYSLIFASRKEQARVFKKWITGAVLPAIRQHGGYINGMEALAPERQQETLVIVHEEALRVGLDAAEEREARSDAFKLLNRGRVRKKARR